MDDVKHAGREDKADIPYKLLEEMGGSKRYFTRFTVRLLPTCFQTNVK